MSDAFKEANKDLQYDVLIIGAGLSGIHSLHRIRELGLRVKALEAGSGEGGTWFWNRYPGARFDSESVSYTFSFSQEVLDKWSWKEAFSAQPETLQYINFVVDTLDLRRSMQFNTRVQSMKFRQDSNSWLLTDDQDRQYTTRYIITAIGILNEPVLPAIPGVADFKGPSWHTARWPQNIGPGELHGKRVGIIGTGATGVQVIQDIHKQCASLTVFQRRPNWTLPVRNSKISPEKMEELRKDYPQVFKICAASPLSFMHLPDPRKVSDYSPEEFLARCEEIYQKPGFAKAVGAPWDIWVDPAANQLYGAFVAGKIKQRLNDPALAEKLVPTCHGFGTRRIPLETNYYEAFNEKNVRLVDVKEAPIERITENGIRLSRGSETEDIELDYIIYATGFDSATGSFRVVDIEGVDGQKLWEDNWQNQLSTYLGVAVPKFPNLFMVAGPQQMFGNMPRSIEYIGGWIADLIKFAVDRTALRIEANPDKTAEWYDHLHTLGAHAMNSQVDSWMTNVNTNLEHKKKRTMIMYNGTAQMYQAQCDGIREGGFQEFDMVFGEKAKENGVQP